MFYVWRMLWSNITCKWKGNKKNKKYVVEHNIKINVNPINTLSEKMIDLTCPFRNNKERKCDIYEVRPKICRSFICNLKNIDNIDKINRIYKNC